MSCADRTTGQESPQQLENPRRAHSAGRAEVNKRIEYLIASMGEWCFVQCTKARSIELTPEEQADLDLVARRTTSAARDVIPAGVIFARGGRGQQ